MSRRVLLTGSGPLVTGLRAGLEARGASTRVGWPAEPDRPGCRALLESTVDHLGGLDLVVHAWVHPAALVRRPVVDLDEGAWAGACEATLDGAYRLAQAAHPVLAGRGGRLVYVVPTIALGGADGYAALAAAAEGIRVLAKGIAKTWGGTGITVNTVAVDPRHLLGDEEGTAASRALSLSPPALGHQGDPATDLAPLIDLLAGDDAHFLTGATLVADGGVWMAR